MSRLDAIADELGVTVEKARVYTREVRQHFEAAPSYAQILVVLRHFDTRPSVGQVVAELKKSQEAGQVTPRSGERGREANRSRAAPARRRGKRLKPTSPRHKARYGRKKPQSG